MADAPLQTELHPVVLHDKDAIPFTDSNPLPVAVVSDFKNRPSFATGQKDVAIKGTGVQLPDQAMPDGFYVSIIAKKSNTKNIYLGNSKAHAEDHAVADILGPGDVRRLGITNWNLMWIDADVAGEGVTILSET